VLHLWDDRMRLVHHVDKAVGDALRAGPEGGGVLLLHAELLRGRAHALLLHALRFGRRTQGPRGQR